MTRQNRTLSILLLLALLFGSLSPGAGWALPALAQDTATPGGRPPGSRPNSSWEISSFTTMVEETRPADGLIEVGREGDLVFLAERDTPPYDQLFASVQTAEGDRLARYLAEIPVAPEGEADAANPCRAEPLEFGDLDTGNGVYAFAGADDVDLDGLATIATTNRRADHPR